MDTIAKNLQYSILQAHCGLYIYSRSIADDDNEIIRQKFKKQKDIHIAFQDKDVARHDGHKVLGNTYLSTTCFRGKVLIAPCPSNFRKGLM